VNFFLRFVYAAGVGSVAAALTVIAVGAQPVNTSANPGFAPNSLGHLIWTNFIAHTNGRSMAIWSRYELPTNFPAGFLPATNLPPDTTPTLAWNPTCLMWGLRGETALSQCWTAQGYRGQVPVTAITRRHGYTRGHSMGEAGRTDHFNGQRIYFCTTNNRVVEVVVREATVEIGKGYDFTILLFDRDLPGDIEPIRVVDLNVLVAKYPPTLKPWIAFWPEQGGQVSAMCEPFLVNTWKPGDSGSPNLLPLPGELVFYGGRSTSGPSPQMQADMDELSRRAGLDPQAYQLQGCDLSRFPSFP